MAAAGMAPVLLTNPQFLPPSTSFIFSTLPSHLHLLPISNPFTSQNCDLGKIPLSVDAIFSHRNPKFRLHLNPNLPKSHGGRGTEASMAIWRTWCLCVEMLGEEEVEEGVRVSREFEYQREGPMRRKRMPDSGTEISTAPFQFVQATRLPDWCKLGGMPNIILGLSKGYFFQKHFIIRNMCSPEKMKVVYRKAVEEFKISPRDCGSSPVQIARLTTKIKYLSSVLHKKDLHNKRGLLMVQQRKRLLKYLRRTNWDSFINVISKLGLRDSKDLISF